MTLVWAVWCSKPLWKHLDRCCLFNLSSFEQRTFPCINTHINPEYLILCHNLKGQTGWRTSDIRPVWPFAESDRIHMKMGYMCVYVCEIELFVFVQLSLILCDGGHLHSCEVTTTEWQEWQSSAPHTHIHTHSLEGGEVMTRVRCGGTHHSNSFCHFNQQTQNQILEPEFGSQCWLSLSLARFLILCWNSHTNIQGAVLPVMMCGCCSTCKRKKNKMPELAALL